MERARPPEDISPEAFFVDWVPGAVADDPARGARLVGTDALVEFTLRGSDGGCFCIHVASGIVSGAVGPGVEPDLRVDLSVDTWRKLNRGDLSAPEAILKREMKFQGSFLLGLKLHLILG